MEFVPSNGWTEYTSIQLDLLMLASSAESSMSNVWLIGLNFNSTTRLRHIPPDNTGKNTIATHYIKQGNFTSPERVTWLDQAVPDFAAWT